MEFTVPKQARTETTKCAHGFSCLKTGKCGENPMCEVKNSDGYNVLFLKDKQPAICSYRVPFGYGQVCTGPTHYAIQKQRDKGKSMR